MASMNDFDLQSFNDRNRRRQEEMRVHSREQAIDSSRSALDLASSISGIFLPPVGAALSAASSAVGAGNSIAKMSNGESSSIGSLIRDLGGIGGSVARAVQSSRNRVKR